MLHFRQFLSGRKEYLLTKIGFAIALIGILMEANPMVTAAADQRPYLLASKGIPVSIPGTCNSVVFAQVPGHSDYFLGRLGNSGRWPQSCADTRSGWGLAVFKMDWNTHTLNFEKFVLQPPVRISSGTTTMLLGSAYDPSVIFYNNELWVAFECSGPGYGGWSCIGPLDWNKDSIDTSRTNVIVSGRDADPNSPHAYSASVPNVFVFDGKVYVYWSAIQVLKSTHAWQQISIRGMQLIQESSGLRRFWGAGSGERPAPSYDPRRNVEVVGTIPNDPSANQSVDLKGLYTSGSYIYVIVGVGGKGEHGNQKCLEPGGTSYGCMRLRIYRSATPLGTDIFNASMLTWPQLPMNPADYQRPCTVPDGSVHVIGEFFHPRSSFAYPQAKVLPLPNGGLLIYPFDVSSFKFSG